MSEEEEEEELASEACDRVLQSKPQAWQPCTLARDRHTLLLHTNTNSLYLPPSSILIFLSAFLFAEYSSVFVVPYIYIYAVVFDNGVLFFAQLRSRMLPVMRSKLGRAASEGGKSLFS